MRILKRISLLLLSLVMIISRVAVQQILTTKMNERVLIDLLKDNLLKQWKVIIQLRMFF